ncbi:MAG: dethiobiotin synthase [Planctomycetota bacterium]|nr:dethiobiotin synthase [Planctomycetota bacterium]
MQTIFVTGTDTGVGKTHVACCLIRQLRQTGLNVGAYKPACSGAEYDAAGHPVWSDVELLHAAAGLDVSLDLICPQRFLAAVAPNVAAELEGRSVSTELLISGVSAWAKIADVLIVEGAGGLFCPLSDGLTVFDLALRVQAPMVVVAANRLGVINHTRLTVERIRQSGLNIAAVVLNELQIPHRNDASLMTNARQISHWIPDVALLHLEFQGENMRVLSGGQRLTNPLLQRIICQN